MIAIFKGSFYALAKKIDPLSMSMYREVIRTCFEPDNIRVVLAEVAASQYGDGVFVLEDVASGTYFTMSVEGTSASGWSSEINKKINDYSYKGNLESYDPPLSTNVIMVLQGTMVPFDDEVKCICYRAIKDIKRGDELSRAYGKDYWKEYEFWKARPSCLWRQTHKHEDLPDDYVYIESYGRLTGNLRVKVYGKKILDKYYYAYEAPEGPKWLDISNPDNTILEPQQSFIRFCGARYFRTSYLSEAQCTESTESTESPGLILDARNSLVPPIRFLDASKDGQEHILYHYLHTDISKLSNLDLSLSPELLQSLHDMIFYPKMFTINKNLAPILDLMSDILTEEDDFLIYKHGPIELWGKGSLSSNQIKDLLWHYLKVYNYKKLNALTDFYHDQIKSLVTPADTFGILCECPWIYSPGHEKQDLQGIVGWMKRLYPISEWLSTKDIDIVSKIWASKKQAVISWLETLTMDEIGSIRLES